MSSSLRKAANFIVVISICLFFVFSDWHSAFPYEIHKKRNVPTFLEDIYREIVQLGKDPGYDFFERQFFVGVDDDDTNKDIHCVIMIQEISGIDRMTIQLTYMERVQRKPVIGIARYVKNIKCSFGTEHPDILTCDYSEPEMRALLPDILDSIRNKKKLLQMKHP